MSMSLRNLVLTVALLLVAASFSFSSAFLFPVSSTYKGKSSVSALASSRRPTFTTTVFKAAEGDEPMIGPQVPGPPPAPTPTPAPEPVVEEENLTDEEKEQRAKMEKIKEMKAKEVFIKTETGDFECQICGWQYLEEKGYGPYKPGTEFAALPADFKCPNCKAGKGSFAPVIKTIAGFSDNRQYGFGGNNLTSEQKGGLIFGGLFFFFALFLSGYLLE